MTNSESIFQFGPNAYTKPAIGLMILRETILGRENFDFAFKEFCERWKFKRPEPSDFFRTMEDASGVDLDWFWHGWFYTTDHVDIAVSGIKRYLLDDGDPKKQKLREKEENEKDQTNNLTTERYADTPKYVEQHGEDLLDFYDRFNRYAVTEKETEKRDEFLKELDPWELDLLKNKAILQVVTFENKGGLVMPLPLTLHFKDESTEKIQLPAEVWKKDHRKMHKLFVTDQPIIKVTFDKREETADTKTENNTWPQEIDEDYFDLERWDNGENPMREEKERAEKEKSDTE